MFIFFFIKMCAGAVLRSRRICFVSVERKTILNADNVWHFVHRAYCLQELWYERSWQLIRRRDGKYQKRCVGYRRNSKRGGECNGRARARTVRESVCAAQLEKDRAAEVKGA